MWRVFWVPQDAVRAGVRRRVLAGSGSVDLPEREDRAGVRAGDPVFLSGQLAGGTGFAMRPWIELFPELLRDGVLDNRRS